MLDFFPQEKITKEVRASLDLLVSAFVSLAEDLLREEDLPDDQDEILKGNETIAMPIATHNNT